MYGRVLALGKLPERETHTDYDGRARNGETDENNLLRGVMRGDEARGNGV